MKNQSKIFKKTFFALPIITLLAAGCGLSGPDNSSNTQNQPTPTPTEIMAKPTPTTTGTNGNNSMDKGSPWQATLMASDNNTKGKYMITVNNHTVYINTSRDYSQLLGKDVNVSYLGTMDSFILGNITAK
jgi:hypothetical protein